MPFVMAYLSFLRRRTYAKKQGDRPAESRYELASFHLIT
jgi:hypothetical protein